MLTICRLGEFVERIRERWSFEDWSGQSVRNFDQSNKA